jgi:hypothetical protein
MFAGALHATTGVGDGPGVARPFRPTMIGTRPARVVVTSVSMTTKFLLVACLVAAIGCSNRHPSARASEFGGLTYGGDPYGGSGSGSDPTTCGDVDCSSCTDFWEFSADGVSDDTPPGDAGVPDPDAGPATPDAGPLDADADAPGVDAGVPDADAPGVDAGVPDADADAPGVDAGVPDADASPPGVDAGVPDADAGLTFDADWRSARPGTALSGAIHASAAEVLTAEVLADGTIRILNAAGTVVETYPKAAVNIGGQWVIKWKGAPPQSLVNVRFVKIAKCFGVIGGLLMISELTYAGVNVALGPAAAQMGVRLQDCQDRFAKVIAGINCLYHQPAAATCAASVAACPDAFFGGNLVMSCGAEDGMNALVDALAAAINGTAVRAGGWGTISPDPAGQIASAIRSGTFALNSGATCTLRPTVSNCTFVNGSVFPAPAGFTEAKACWEGASRGIFETKWEEAYNCCTTNECRGSLQLVKNC